MEIFLNLITRPEETIYNISRRDLGYSGFLILLVASISIVAGHTLFSGATAGIILYSLTWGLLLKLILLGFILFFIAALYHYFAGVFGGRGDGVKLFKALPYSFIPYCFVAPITLILKAFADGTKLFLPTIAFLLLLFWMAFLQLKIINYFYGLSPNNALIVFILPWIIVGGFMIILPVIVSMSILALFISI
jgi:hypothetical protein